MVVRKMKEKCKDAARMRREKERAEFVELSKLLPLPSSTTSQLDKASIIRLTSSYLRMRAAFPQGLGGNWGNEYRVRAANKLATQQQQQPSQFSGTSTSQQSQDLQQQLQQQMQMHVKELGSLILQTLDGFVFALHSDGKIMYISETASVHLGLPQIDLTGSSVFEYVHPSDHNDIYEILSLNEAEKAHLNSNLTSATQNATCELGRSFCMRMKCILPKRNAGLVSSGYKAIHCNGYLKVRLGKSGPKIGANNYINGGTNGGGVANVASGDNNNDDNCSGSSVSATEQTLSSVNTNSSQGEWESYALVAVGHSLLPTASTEVKLTGNSFMFRANLDLKLYYIETTVIKLLGFEQIDMIGQSLYQLVHVTDVAGLEKSHRSLLEKGQVVTKYYRLIKKDGGSIWVQSYATLVNNPRNMPKPQHIVSICFVLGDNQLDDSCIFYNQEQANVTSGEVAAGISIQKQQKSQKKLPPVKRIRKTKIQVGEAENLTQLAAQPAPLALQQQQSPPLNHHNQQQHRQDDSKSTSSCSSSSSSSGGGGSGSNGSSSSIGSNSFVQQLNTHCACLLPVYAGNSVDRQANINQVGTIRRPSDDSCSVMSSVASTCIYSNSSFRHNSDFFGYTTNEAGYSSDHPMTGHGYSLPTYSEKSTSMSSISSIDPQRNHHQQHHQQQQLSSVTTAAPLTPAIAVTTMSNPVTFYNEFCLPQQKYHGHNHRHSQPMQTQINDSIISSSNGTTLNSRVWSPTKNLIVDDLHAQVSMKDDRVVGFNQPTCNVTSQYFQSSPDWLAQANCSNLTFVREHKNSNESTNDYHYNVNDDSSAYSVDNCSMGSSPHYTHKSPSYLGNAGTIHYQQVPVDNGYTM